MAPHESAAGAHGHDSRGHSESRTTRTVQGRILIRGKRHSALLSHASLNALLNGAAFVLLLAGYTQIRRGRVQAHRMCMLSAFGVSTAFLLSYSIYHFRAGSVPFTASGWIRPVYFAILISHIVLAAGIVPLALLTLRRGLRGDYPRHKRLARITLPLWLYVSITGILIYLLLYHIYPSQPAVDSAFGQVCLSVDTEVR
ncbi:MAG: DUF420 domain-containing protein [Firmicutes bacterium]|nr:DUF420 domain-containing protein [Bacillota bacterium]